MHTSDIAQVVHQSRPWRHPGNSGCRVLVVAVLLWSLAGCDSLRSGLAQAIGAPTPAEIEAVVADLETAGGQLADLTRRAEAADQANQAESREAHRLGLQAQILREQIGTVAGQLAGASGAAWGALEQTLQHMVADLRTLEGVAKTHIEVAQEYGQIAAQISVEVARQTLKIRSAEMDLDAFDWQAQQAVAAAMSGVAGAAELAQTLGVPGAKLVGQQIATAGAGLVALVLGGGAGYQTLRHRRERVRRRGLDEVVRANEVHGLIRDDPASKELARASLSTAAATALALAKLPTRI